MRAMTAEPLSTPGAVGPIVAPELRREALASLPKGLGAPRANARPPRTTWTFADGASVCAQDDRALAGLMRKMIAALSAAEQAELAAVLAERRLRPAGP
jgi:hypothetical protein